MNQAQFDKLRHTDVLAVTTEAKKALALAEECYRDEEYDMAEMQCECAIKELQKAHEALKAKAHCQIFGNKLKEQGQ